MNRLIPELARCLKSNPGDEAALDALFKTVREGGLAGELIAMLDVLSEAEEGVHVPNAALAELYYQIAKRCPEAQAHELCRMALDLCPSHASALSLLEELTDETWADELCARYQSFLEAEPTHEASPRFRVAMIERQEWALC